MRIWVDADACPNPIKEILFRAAERLKTQLTLVANKPLRTPPSAYINTIQVAAGFDMADDKIAQEVRAGDLVVTADIPARRRRARQGRPRARSARRNLYQGQYRSEARHA